MYPPTDTPIDPLGLPPAPAAPALPTPAQPKSMNPIAKSVLVALAAMAGPGRGTGILQGLSLADQQAQARAQQQNALAVQDYTRQHQAYQDEQRTYQQQQTQRAAMLKNVLDSFQTELANTKSDAEAESLYQTAGQVLSAQGFRGFDAASLKRKYHTPSAQERAAKAVNKFLGDKAAQQTLENDPESLNNVMIDLGNGVMVPFASAREQAGLAPLKGKPKTAPASSQTPREGVMDGKQVFWTMGADGQAQIVQGVRPTPPAPRERTGSLTPREGVVDGKPVFFVMGPDGRPQIVQGVSPAPSGAAGGPAKLSTAQQEDMSTMLVLEKMANDVESLGDRTNWDGVGGWRKGSISAFKAKNLGKGTSESVGLRSQIGNINATIAKLRGGTSFTDGEKQLLEQYTPTIDEDKMVIKGKLSWLRQFIADKRSATVNVASGDFRPLPSHGQSNGGNTVTIGGKKFGVQVIP